MRPSRALLANQTTVDRLRVEVEVMSDAAREALLWLDCTGVPAECPHCLLHAALARVGRLGDPSERTVAR